MLQQPMQSHWPQMGSLINGHLLQAHSLPSSTHAPPQGHMTPWAAQHFAPYWPPGDPSPCTVSCLRDAGAFRRAEAMLRVEGVVAGLLKVACDAADPVVSPGIGQISHPR